MTLTQASLITKRAIYATVIVFILLIAAPIGFNIAYQYIVASRPTPTEKPQMKFGALPKLNFPPSIQSSQFTYSLDTATGGLPTTPKVLRVYFIPRTGISLLAPERAKILAASLGFNNPPEVLSASEYKFTNNLGGQLLVDLTTGNFHLQRRAVTSDNLIASNPLTPQDLQLPSEEKLVELFKNYLSSKGLLKPEISQGGSKVIYNGLSRADAKSAEVSIWPVDIDKLPVVTASFSKSLVRATITTAKEEPDKFVKVDYTIWPVDPTTFSTYPLKTPQQAFEDLKKNISYVSIEPFSDHVSITTVYLTYYQSESYSPYLQPVFVFEGPNFTAFVPAVKEK